MRFAPLTLWGKNVRLEPLDRSHLEALVEAAAQDGSLYRWTIVPKTQSEAAEYIDTALAWREAGTAVPFVTVRTVDGAVIGSTRFWNIEHWDRPLRRELPEACEIGYTWLTSSAIRTAANTEAKLLMLTHAFEEWNVCRVCFTTDARNERSRRAIDRLGAKFEGVLRAHRLAADLTVRDSARFSILSEEWPEVKQRLLGYLL